MITSIIADDEAHARERLRELLESFDCFDIIGEATDGNEAVNMIITHKPQVTFLDINMPGVSVFQSIPSLQDPPLVVFQTAYSQHAANAFEIDAVDYLLKPVRMERLEKTVAKIKERLSRKLAVLPAPADTDLKLTGYISVKISGKTRVIAIKEIVRISFENGYCYLYTSTEKIISDKYLNHYEEKLQEHKFYRTSRNDIINLDQISMIHKLSQSDYTVELKNGAKIDLSRRKAQQLKKIIG
ncbi:MAG TPA: LytTR family transcriptional regulator DNA-binding domain-containing protein [Chitinispirillaceae bacterium]|nr:LytTR family transcriptional regulator DNA-binding domain-containing protein [Chitinispirillaceae bacterium]